MIIIANNKLVWIAIIAGGLIFSSGYVEARQKGGSPLRDVEITQAVESALRYDYAVPSDNIGIVTTNGRVTLSGAVPDLLTRDRAERVAATVLGVREVKDEIKVIPVLRSDGEIAADVRAALAIDPVIGSRNLKVKVSGGMVQVSGTVGSSVERVRARQLAMSVPGVSGVKVDLPILFKARRSDSAIASDIKELLRTNVAFRETALSPAVHDGTVSFSGVVVSSAQRDELRNDAWLPGVKNVDVSGVRVDPWAAGPGAPLNLKNGMTTGTSTK